MANWLRQHSAMAKWLSSRESNIVSSYRDSRTADQTSLSPSSAGFSTTCPHTKGTESSHHHKNRVRQLRKPDGRPEKAFPFLRQVLQPMPHTKGMELWHQAESAILQ
jgi:hypothetical protein